MVQYNILIPAYNAAHTLPVLLKQISGLEKQPDKIYVIDDGSSDETAKTLNQANLEMVQNDKNRGKGFSLKKGFALFLEQDKAGYLLCMDADLQHPVESVNTFLEAAERGGHKIIIGKRKKFFAGMPVLRIISNSLTSLILTLVSRRKIADSQCGFRLIHRSVLERVTLKENGFQLETEFILEAARHKFDFAFVQIPTIYNGSHSYINHLGDTFTFLKIVGRRIFLWK